MARRTRCRPIPIGLLILLGLSCAPSGALSAQQRSEAVHWLRDGNPAVVDPPPRLRRGPLKEEVEHLRNPRGWQTYANLSTSRERGTQRAEFPGGDVMLRQSTAGLIGGVAGALAILLPLAAADRGGTEVNDDGMTVGALLGYLGGSAVGVQYYSNRQAMHASWWGTLGGSALGVLGGPLLVVTVPIGAMAGFNLTRED